MREGSAERALSSSFSALALRGDRGPGVGVVVGCAGVLIAPEQHRNQHAGQHARVLGDHQAALREARPSTPVTANGGISIEAAISMFGREACPR